MSNIISSMKENKKVLIAMILAIILIVLVVVAAAIFFQNQKKTITYSEMETELVKATRKYLQANSSLIPSYSNPTAIVDSNELISGDYLKDIDKQVNDNSCSATVTVTYIEDNKFNFKPQLMCANYQTIDFIDKVIEDNPYIPDIQGLYDLNGEMVFRGENPNNHVNFAGKSWRIVKMEQNGEVTLILNDAESNNFDNMAYDDRYNIELGNNRGINNYELSRVKEFLLTKYESTFKDYSTVMIPFQNCIANRGMDDIDNSGTKECMAYSEENYLQLLPLYDYINASLDSTCYAASDKNCQNYNYLKHTKIRWWLSTPSDENTSKVFSVKNTGLIETDYASSKKQIRYIIKINGDQIYQSGNGTAGSPYVFKVN